MVTHFLGFHILHPLVRYSTFVYIYIGGPLTINIILQRTAAIPTHTFKAFGQFQTITNTRNDLTFHCGNYDTVHHNRAVSCNPVLQFSLIVETITSLIGISNTQNNFIIFLIHIPLSHFTL